jgi:hypothetical protein
MSFRVSAMKGERGSRHVILKLEMVSNRSPEGVPVVTAAPMTSKM